MRPDSTESSTERVQRLRITFACDDAVKYISHLDLMRVWERVMRRAHVPVVYSQGFSPHPRIAMAAPLAVGVSSEAELLDVVLHARVRFDEISAAIEAQLPAGLRIVAVDELPMGLASLQSLTRTASYEVEVEDGRAASEWQSAIDGLLAKQTLPWEHTRGEKLKRYDLRHLIHEIELRKIGDGRATLFMRLGNDEKGSGRPEQVARALGVSEEPLRMHRTALELEIPSLARAAARAAGYDRR